MVSRGGGTVRRVVVCGKGSPEAPALASGRSPPPALFAVLGRGRHLVPAGRACYPELHPSPASPGPFLFLMSFSKNQAVGGRSC